MCHPRMASNALCLLYHKHYITHKGRDHEGLGLLGSVDAPHQGSYSSDSASSTG